MKGVTTALTVATSLLYGTLASAEGLKQLPYTGVQLSYGQTDFDDLDVDADGFGVDAFFEVGSNVFISGGYGTAETDEFTVLGVRGSIKSSGFGVGLGYHHPLSSTVDLVPTISIIDAKVEAQGGFSGAVPDEDDTGWSAGVALRALVNPHLEITGGVDYTDLFDDDSTSFGVGAFWYPVDKLGLGADYDVSDDSKTLGVNARVLF